MQQKNWDWFFEKCRNYGFKPVKTKYGFSLYSSGKQSGWKVFIHNDGKAFSIRFIDGKDTIESHLAKTESGLSRKMNIAFRNC